jgi:hypothetical protein
VKLELRASRLAGRRHDVTRAVAHIKVRMAQCLEGDYESLVREPGEGPSKDGPYNYEPKKVRHLERDPMPAGAHREDDAARQNPVLESGQPPWKRSKGRRPFIGDVAAGPSCGSAKGRSIRHSSTWIGRSDSASPMPISSDLVWYLTAEVNRLLRPAF